MGCTANSNVSITQTSTWSRKTTHCIVSIILQTTKRVSTQLIRGNSDLLGVEEASRSAVKLANLPNSGWSGFSRIYVSRDRASRCDCDRAGRNGEFALVHCKGIKLNTKRFSESGQTHSSWCMCQASWQESNSCQRTPHAPCSSDKSLLN